MAHALGLKFEPEGRVQFFQPGELDLERQDFCVVVDEVDNERERVGYVACLESVCPCRLKALPVVRRRASQEEIQGWSRLAQRKREALEAIRGLVVDHDLPMKVINVRFDDVQNLITFNFTADRRIDFRELVRDLAAHFRARIELWQIGSRQGAAEKDGFGVCGLQMCCSAWMHEFPAVSIRHAREQDLHQPPAKLSGLCGRLRCCLRFESDAYCELTRDAPPVGSIVRDATGQEGLVLDRNLISRVALVSVQRARNYWAKFDDLEVLRRNGRAAHPPNGDRPTTRHDEGPTTDEHESIPEDGEEPQDSGG